MKQSKLFTKTRKEAPKDEEAVNAKLLIRGGFIHKEMAGVYAYLPLGLRVLKNIETIIREEMNAIGGQELLLTALQQQHVWEKVGRWDDEVVDVWFKTRLKDEMELGFGFTHDEQLVNLLTKHVNSHRDLPLYIYQIQTKFRNELRAKSGILRGREFLMKDLYSFNTSEEEQDEFYEKIKNAYIRIFERCGIGDITYFTLAGGGTFSEFSHEFQTTSDAGEDTIYIDKKGRIAVNSEVMNAETLDRLGLSEDGLEKTTSIEVGNIFKQGTKFTEPFGLTYIDGDGREKPVYMGGYGIGVSRLMGTVAEVLSDEKGIVWPESIAPFQIHLLSLGKDEEAEELYHGLEEKGIEVLFDDRDIAAGEKFADSDLIGIPYRVVVSEKTVEEDGIEVKKRSEEGERIITKDELVRTVQSKGE